MYLTKAEICAALQISYSTLDRLIASHEFPGPERLGKRILRWHPDVLGRLLAEIEAQPDSAVVIQTIESIVSKTPGGARQAARDLGLTYARLKQLIAGDRMTWCEHAKIVKRGADLVGQTTIFSG